MELTIQTAINNCLTMPDSAHKICPLLTYGANTSLEINTRMNTNTNAARQMDKDSEMDRKRSMELDK